MYNFRIIKKFYSKTTSRFNMVFLKNIPISNIFNDQSYVEGVVSMCRHIIYSRYQK